MSGSSSDATLRLSLPTVETAARPLEQEVIELFEQLRNRILRYLLSLGLPAHDGEEIIQEVFLALFQHLRRGKSRANLRGWVFRVAHNLAMRQRNASRREVQDCTDPGEGADPSPNPEEQVLTNQRQQLLLAVVRALPEQDQYCLYLRAEGLKYREIADVLGISLGSVSNSLAKSLERLGRADGR